MNEIINYTILIEKLLKRIELRITQLFNEHREKCRDL